MLDSSVGSIFCTPVSGCFLESSNDKNNNFINIYNTEKKKRRRKNTSFNFNLKLIRYCTHWHKDIYSPIISEIIGKCFKLVSIQM